MQELLESVETLSPQQRKGLIALLKQQGINFFEVTPISKRQPGEPLRASFAQQRQWFLWQLDPDSAAYHIPTALRLRGQLNSDALTRTLNALIARHEILRTTFDQRNETVLQIIHPELPLAVESAALAFVAGETTTEREGRLQQRLEAHIQLPFDLRSGPLLRATLLRVTDNENVLLLVQHHIVSDGVSMQIMVDELVQLYAAFSAGNSVLLPPLSIQYADYALWQRNWMEAGEQERQLAYWMQQLGGEQPVLELPTDYARPAIQTYAGASIRIALASHLSQSLQQKAHRQNITLFTLLLASFQVLLYRYSGQSDIRIGVPIANRSRVETEQLLGFFVNTQVIRADVDSQLPFDTFLQQVQRIALDAQAHQDLPFEQLVEALQPARSLSRSPLFQVMYNHQSEMRQAEGQSHTTQLPGLIIHDLNFAVKSTQFDLALDTYESDAGLFAELTYSTDLFDAATIEQMAAHWQLLLTSICRDATQRIGELPLLSIAEYRQHTLDWNAAAVIAPLDFCVHTLIEWQAIKTPDAIALLCGTEELSFSQLNRRANQLAHRLIELGIGADMRVAVAVERSLNMVIGLLAILKAGGAYVPLDLDYPQERLSYMIADSGIQLLLTQSHLQNVLSVPPHIKRLNLDQTDSYSDAATNPPLRAHPDNLAYVIYTSGSTGRPKGVGISHRALSSHAAISVDFFDLSAADRVLQFATFNFDGFVEQLYPALICGASVVIRGQDIWDSETFYRELIANDISVVDVTTAYWFMLVKDFSLRTVQHGARDYGRLRRLHVGGEAMPPEGLIAWQRAGLAHVDLLNTYGPTEATVTATAHNCANYCRAGEALPLLMPIGQSLPGRSLYLFDNTGDIAARGVVGELVIGGELLARGYHGRAGLTAERFLPNPFDERGGRMYRTGDLVRYRNDSAIEYVGRIDHQIKIRGFRIELGEIEARLQEQSAVREAVVIAQQSPTGQQLVGYVVPANSQLFTAGLIEAQRNYVEELKSALRLKLPDYMVPPFLVLLEKLPLSPNGKLDRSALPMPDISALQKAYVAPANDLEKQVAAIWQEVLGVERIGMNDNFFELGGHSLLVAQVISKTCVQINVELSLRALFEKSVLHEFVEEIAAKVNGNVDKLARLESFIESMEAF